MLCCLAKKIKRIYFVNVGAETCALGWKVEGRIFSYILLIIYIMILVKLYSRCFSGTLLLFWWSNGCWQFDLWFPAFSKSSLNIWKFMVHLLLKPGLENFEHFSASMWDECNCVVVWAFFGIAFLWHWNEKWPFPVLWPLLSFPNLLVFCVQHFHSIIFQVLK